MDYRKALDMALMEQGKDIKWLAGELGIGVRSLRNKLYRGTFSLKDYEQMLGLVGSGLAVITKEGSILR